MVEAATLAKYGVSAEGVTHWILASQTCNLFNESLEKVPKVEWVGAVLLKGGHDERLAAGSHPRQIHLECSGPNTIWLNASIVCRAWVDRALLAKMPSPEYAVNDSSASLDGRWRERFANWMSRSYTRAEFPDEFNTALKNSGVEPFLRKRLSTHGDKLYGIFFEIEPEAGIPDSLSLREIAELRPPYRLVLTFVVKQVSDVAALRDESKKLFELTMNDPDGAEGSDGRKIKVSRAELARRAGITILADQVSVLHISAWTVEDLLNTVRFTDLDYLSDSSEMLSS